MRPKPSDARRPGCRWLLGLCLVASACAAPAAQKKAAATPQLECPNLDVQRLGDISAIDRENQEERNRVTDLEKRLNDLQGQLQGSLSGTDQNQASVAIDEGKKVRVRISDELLFRSGSARISRAGRRALSQVASVLKGTPSKRIEVAGYTDDVPMSKKYADNWQLSLERAHRVVLYLISQGLDGKRLMLTGYGDTAPVDTSDTREARAKNRRVEIFIEPTAAAETTDATPSQ